MESKDEAVIHIISFTCSKTGFNFRIYSLPIEVRKWKRIQNASLFFPAY